MRRLNGWQRLWVVLSALYLVAVVWVTILVFPDPAEIESSRVHDSIRAVGEHREKSEKDFRFEGAYSVRTRYYSDLTNDQIITGLHDKWHGQIDFSRIENEYRSKLDALPAERARTVGLAFLAWLAPVAVIYVMGLAVAWIIRGFRNEKP